MFGAYVNYVFAQIDLFSILKMQINFEFKSLRSVKVRDVSSESLVDNSALLHENGIYSYSTDNTTVKIKSTSKEAGAQLPPLLMLSYTFLLRQLDANISPVINIKHCYLLLE